MSFKPSLHLGALTITLGLAASSLTVSAHAAPPLQPTSVVVTVDGKAIRYSEIAVSDTNIIRKRSRGLSVPPLRTVTPEELEIARHQVENSDLANLIQGIVRPNLIREYRIQASDDEIQTQVKLQLNGQSIEAITKQTREQYAITFKALESVYNGQETEASAYEKYMNPIGSLETWQAYLAAYKTPESRLSLKAMSEITVEATQKSYEILAREQIQEKN